MNAIALVDTTGSRTPGESIGTVISTHNTSTHNTMAAAFKANEAFQKRMRESGVKDHVPTKLVTLYAEALRRTGLEDLANRRSNRRSRW
jgi:hypothetical protein